MPFRDRRLKRWQCRHTSSHAEIRCLGDRPWLLRKLRRSTNRFIDLVNAVLALHHASA
ncbi:hypothetical protein ACIODW_00835 [Streptomyces sp. NPDC087897]|uniref:hypothetical protein n=1 Tax=Streptomyces sp. NPDC087897 TaxID=3365817 RepID=UPI0037FDF97C